MYLNKILNNSNEPEVHIIGEIVGAFDLCSNNAFCAFEVTTGNLWTHVEGLINGQTQLDHPNNKEIVIWNHPIDLHYYTRSLEGWPKFVFEVWNIDTYGNENIIGYSFLPLPKTPGFHELEASIWRPSGSLREEMTNFFLGQTPQLLSAELIYDPIKAKQDRPHLTTSYVGKIQVSLNILLRNMNECDVNI